MNKEMNIDDVLICPNCGGDLTITSDDELDFGNDFCSKPHYNFDAYCPKCGKTGRIYTEFEYKITKFSTRGFNS